MSMPLPGKKNIPIVSKRSTDAEKLTGEQVLKFMNKNGISEKEMAEIFGVSIPAVRLWLSGERSFSVTNSRLINLFNKYPELIREF
jgi:transcriptional regulator with XRE-family HTH domain